MTVTDTTTGTRTSMQVRKRNGDTEPVDVNKIVRAVDRRRRPGRGRPDAGRDKTISGLYDGATTAELDRLSIETAAEMIGGSRSTPGWPPGCCRATSTRRPRPGRRLRQSIAPATPRG